MLCIKRDQNVETPGQNCELSASVPVNLRYQSPLTISRIEQNVFPRGGNEVELMLTMDVQKSGSGSIVSKEDIYITSTKDEEPLVDISLNLTGVTKNFKCIPVVNENRISMKEDRKTIKCSSTFNLKEDYISNPLEIKLSYGYKTTKTTNSINLVPKEI
jgi:hypothetical protein